MNVYRTREVLKTCSIFDLKLKVAFYARVSTESEDQQVSIHHQDEYYRNFIAKNKNWVFVGAYIDNGISGIRTEKRDEFQRMMADAKTGKIDMIVTKEITRFARNTLDSIRYTRELLMYGVCVWFQNDNINTIDEDSELRLTIMSGIAQDESRKLSNRIKFGHAQSIKNGVVLGARIYGYIKKDGKLTIDPKTAPMVKEIFEKYSTGEWSTSTIEKYLYKKGYRNYKGGKLSRDNIKKIIKNPKYKGYYCGGKVKVVDMFTKKQEFLPEDEWTMYKDDGNHVPQIVDESVWNKANVIMQTRSDAIKSHRTSFKQNNLFTGYIFCGNDGAPYWMKQHTIRGREDARWVCSYRIKNGAQSCNSFGVREKELRVMLADLINKSGDIQAAIEKYISLVEKNIDFSDDWAEISRLKNMVLQLKKKKEKLLDLNLDGIITNSEYLDKSKKFKDEIQNINNKLSELESKEEANKDSHLKLKKIGKILNDLQGVGPEDITKTVLGEFLDKIVINPKRPQECEILFFLKTGDVKKKSIIEQDKQGCSEYFFLTIYPPTDPFCLEVRFPLYPSVSGTPSSFATSYLKRSSAPFASGTTALLEEVLLGIIHFLLGCYLV